jgi:hypothetical protein
MDVVSCVHTVVGESTATRTVPFRLTRRCLFHTHIRRLCVSPLHNMHNLSRRNQTFEITAHPWTLPFTSSKYLPLPSISCLVVKLPPPPPVALSEAKPSRRKLAQPVDCSPWPCPHNKLSSVSYSCVQLQLVLLSHSVRTYRAPGQEQLQFVRVYGQRPGVRKDLRPVSRLNCATSCLTGTSISCLSW